MCLSSAKTDHITREPGRTTACGVMVDSLRPPPTTKAKLPMEWLTVWVPMKMESWFIRESGDATKGMEKGRRTSSREDITTRGSLLMIGTVVRELSKAQISCTLAHSEKGCLRVRG